MTKKTPSHKESSTKPDLHQTEPAKSKRIWKWIGVSGGIVVVLILAMIVGYFGFEYKYQAKVYPGVFMNGQSMSGLTYDEVVSIVNTYKDNLKQSGMQFTYEETTMHIDTVTEDEVEHIQVPLVEFNADVTAQAIYGIGRTNNSGADLQTKFQLLFSPIHIDPRISGDTAAIAALLEAEFTHYETEPIDAQLSYDVGGMTIVPHADGQQFMWDDITDTVLTSISTLQPVDIQMTLQPQPAAVTTDRAEQLKPDVLALLERAPITLRYEDREFKIEQDELQTWLGLSADSVILNHEAVDASLDVIAGEIDVPVKEGRYTVYKETGEGEGEDAVEKLRLEQFEQGEPGLGVNVEESIAVIETALLAPDRSGTAPTIEMTDEVVVEVIVEVVEPRATPDNLDELGIKELLGTGTTNFAGSPSNRIGNIQKGADLLHGLLIAPGEEFSLVEALAPIDLSHGWLSELVIKGNKLEKEAGGGLCQIGSTIFRATMMAGLNITERHSHSLAVSYYNYNGKAGVDATIYEPNPDYRFVNDTENWVLIQSRIEGADIYFDIYGTSDGRKGYFTDPVNYAHVSPGPTEEVVDETKPVGYRDCPQHAFSGVSASFDYIIERANGETDTKNFTSTYKAQPALCIVGPEPKEETPPEPPPVTPPITPPAENTNQDTTNDTTDKKDKKKKNKE